MHAPLPRLADLCDSAAPGALARVAAIALLRLAVLPVDLLRVRVRVGVRVGVGVRVRVRVGVRVRCATFPYSCLTSTSVAFISAIIIMT